VYSISMPLAPPLAAYAYRVGDTARVGAPKIFSAAARVLTPGSIPFRTLAAYVA
jgi:hypothetical protein